MDRRHWTVKEPLTPTQKKEIALKNKEITEQNNDIIIEEKIPTTEYKEDGSIVTTFEIKKHNLTKSINETAKLLKADNAQKMQELLAQFGLSDNKEIF